MKSVLFLLLAAASPLAAQPPQVITRAVSTAGLDLTTEAGLRALDHRLTIAVVDACGTASNVDLEDMRAVRTCHLTARADVNAQRDRLVKLASRAKGVTVAAR